MASEFFGRQRECRFYTAGCGKKMAVSVTGPQSYRLYKIADKIDPQHLFSNIEILVIYIWNWPSVLILMD